MFVVELSSIFYLLRATVKEKMLSRHFNWWRLSLQIAILTFYMFKTYAVLHCDEFAVTVQKVKNVHLHTTEVVNNISIECSGVVLPIPSIDTQHNCDGCPRILKISYSNILVVPSAAFSNFPLITTLRIEKLHIKKLSPGAFNTLHYLKEVYLSGNNITELNPGVFNSILQLEVLDLSKNNLKNLGISCLTGTIKLKLLNLSSNSLKMFKDSYLDQNLAELEYIDLSFNQIAQLKIENIQYKIVNIDLSWNKIKNIDFCVSAFKSINISRNELGSLKKNGCSNRTSRVITFDASYNKISALLPDAFVGLSQLKRLNLQHNNISSLPTEFFSQLFNLTDLNLSNNNLEQFVHGTFGSLEKLQFLDISYNKFTTIERYLHSLVNLQELNIQRNKISDLDSGQLVKDLPNLKKIFLDGNNFTCDDLIDKIHDFRSKHVVVANGSVRNMSNVQGISCSDNSNTLMGFSESIGSNFEKIILNKMGQLPDQEIKASAMHEYFNKDFNSSNFLKYLEEIQFNDSGTYEFFNRDFENSKLYKYLENFKHAENFSIEFNKSIHDYFDKDFKNSSFVKYLRNLNNVDDILNGGFLNSKMYKYFNSGFDTSRFDKYLETLKVLLTVTVIILVKIFLIFIILAVMAFLKFNKKKRNNELMELINT